MKQQIPITHRNGEVSRMARVSMPRQRPNPLHPASSRALTPGASCPGNQALQRMLLPVVQRQKAAGVEPEPITSGPKFEAELEEFEGLKERFEAERTRHEERLKPLPLGTLPPDVLKRAGVTETTRTGKSTAALIQSVLERSPLLRPYIGDQLGKKRIPGQKFVHHDFDAEFESAYTKLHKIVIPVGSSEEKALKAIWGFYHPPTNTIHLRPASNTGHALHESIHKFSSPGFRNVFGGYLDEGVTQYFTNKVLEEQGLSKMRASIYQDQENCAGHLVSVVGEDLVAGAYFRSQTSLAKTLAQRLGLTLTEFVRLRKGDELCKKIKRL